MKQDGGWTFEWRLAALALASSLLASCSANHNAVFRHQDVAANGASVTLIDAKQRAILQSQSQKATTTPGTGVSTGAAATTTTTQTTRFCAEPSPDVFSVMAQSLSAGGSFGRTADPKAIEVALNAAFSSAEQGSSIPRTQTINMLRELMFRTCERHLNGGISDLELPLQAIRDQRLMVSILAIEQLTGAVTAKPVVLGAQASAAAGASGAEAAIRLDDLHKDLLAKKTAESTRQTALDELNGTAKDCDKIAAEVAKGETEAAALSAELKAKRPKCEAASSEFAKARSTRAEAATHYAKVSDVAASGGIPVSGQASLMTPVAAGGLDQARAGDVAAVAAVVGDIVSSSFEQDEFLLMCVKVLGGGVAANTSAIEKSCSDYINTALELRKSKADLSKSKVDLQKARNLDAINAAQAATDKVSSSLFDKFWARVSTSGKVDKAKADALKASTGSWNACFDAADSKAAYEACFDGLRAQQKRNLSEGK